MNVSGFAVAPRRGIPPPRGGRSLGAAPHLGLSRGGSGTPRRSGLGRLAPCLAPLNPFGALSVAPVRSPWATEPIALLRPVIRRTYGDRPASAAHQLLRLLLVTSLH